MVGGNVRLICKNGKEAKKILTIPHFHVDEIHNTVFENPNFDPFSPNFHPFYPNFDPFSRSFDSFQGNVI